MDPGWTEQWILVGPDSVRPNGEKCVFISNFCCSSFRKNNPLFWTIVAGDHDRTLKESTEQVRNVFKGHSAYSLNCHMPGNTFGLPLVAQLVRNPPAIQETWVQSLDWEDGLEMGKATHSCIQAWRIPWTWGC